MRRLLLSLFVLLAEGACMKVAPQDLGICAYYGPALYLDNIYFPGDAAVANFASILQQFLQLFVDQPYKHYYWEFACAFAFPNCSQDGLALRACSTGPHACSKSIFSHVCDNVVPMEPAGAACTPIARLLPSQNSSIQE